MEGGVTTYRDTGGWFLPAVFYYGEDEKKKKKWDPERKYSRGRARTRV